MKTYCALGFGNNFFYPLGTDSLPIPPNLLTEEDDEEEEEHGGDNGDNGDNDETNDIENEDVPDDGTRQGAQASLLPINPNAGGQIMRANEDGERASSASEWLRQHVSSRPASDEGAKYSSCARPAVSCGATHTSFVLPKRTASASTPRSSSSSSSGAATGEAHLVGTIFGRTFQKLTVQPTRLPLRIARVSSGRRHVLALTEGASPGGGVVMSWGAGHFGQLGHGPDLTSCLEPRIVERLLPHVVGGNVVEIAAGGLHSAAIVASSSKSQKAFPTNGDGKESIIVRETRTFAWGSNRKGQCGVEGGKCATVPEPLPVIIVKRGETSKKEVDANTDPVDKNVHFEKLSLGRLHTVALTAYGEVFTWGSTSMGRCGHSSTDSARGSDRRFVQQPRHVSALRNVSIEAIAAGGAHTLALSRGGRVFAWGSGSDGQCGQGHAGNLFSPRAVQGLPTGASASQRIGANKRAPTKEEPRDGAKGEDAGEEGRMPHVNSRVAMAVTLEEEALSKALSMSQISNVSPPTIEPKTDKIVSIQASGCYSAAITAHGEVYTWGYGGGAAIGHPIPTEEESLPLIPIIEGNQYSTATAAKVFPEGGGEENVIRDCRCFDTDLNVMLPRRVECTRKLGLVAEDVALGPGHMVILCSLPDDPDDDGGTPNEGREGEPPRVDVEGGRAPAGDDDDGGDADDDATRSGAASGPARGSSGPLDDDDARGRGDARCDESPGGEGARGSGGAAVEAVGSGEDGVRGERRRRSPGGWMTKIKSSRSAGKNCSGQSPAAGPGPEGGEKRKSFMHVGKMLDVALRRGGER